MATLNFRFCGEEKKLAFSYYYFKKTLKIYLFKSLPLATNFY